MAPQKWTSQRDQNLLLLMISEMKPNFQDLANKWKLQFHEEFKPTAKAVSEHVAALKRKMGGSSGTTSTPVAVRSTSASKSKATNGTPRTPASKGKRSRAEMMSNEDDSEDEKVMDLDTPVPKRTTPSRHSVARKYKEENVDSEDEEEILMPSVKPPTSGGAKHRPANADGEGVRPSIARSKSNPPKLDYFRDGDGEDGEDGTFDFEPLT